MTLIEITVALAVVGVMFASVVVGIGALTGSKARAATGELAGVIRSLYDTASLTGKTCRLVFDLGRVSARDDDPPPASYWAECASGAVTAGRDRDARADAEAADKRAAAGDKNRRPPPRSTLGFGASPSLQDLAAQEKDKIEQAATFAEFTSPEISKRQLAGAVKLSVWTRHQKEEATQGRAFLYFFPQGFTEKAMIFVSQGNNAWTVTVASLTGKATIVGDRLEIPRT